MILKRWISWLKHWIQVNRYCILFAADRLLAYTTLSSNQILVLYSIWTWERGAGGIRIKFQQNKYIVKRTWMRKTPTNQELTCNLCTTIMFTKRLIWPQDRYAPLGRGIFARSRQQHKDWKNKTSMTVFVLRTEHKTSPLGQTSGWQSIYIHVCNTYIYLCIHIYLCV